MPSFVSTVTTEAQLDGDIQIIDGTTAPGTYTITFGSAIGETFDLSAINLHSGVTLAINGAGFALDGAKAHRGLLDFNGALTVSNLTISNMLAQGGAGGNAGGYAGGGGAGLGGGLFVAGANIANGTTYGGGTVTLNAVSFSGNAAKGGAGGSSKNFVSDGYAGGGGLGGAGGSGYGNSFGGGGGVGAGATGGATNALIGGTGILVAQSSGIGSAGTGANYGFNTTHAGGSNGGGGGEGNGNVLSTGYGGAAGGGGLGGGAGLSKDQTSSKPGKYGAGGTGGFGGGGGAGYTYGGTGGFGGGGGSGYKAVGNGGFGGGGAAGFKASGAGGFGAGTGGAGGSGGGGGGGLGAGGDVFVQQGGTLIIGAGSLGVGTVGGGAGGSATNAGTGGSAFGSGIFIQNTSTSLTQAITLAPGSGQSLTINGGIADQAGSGGTGGNNTAASIVLSGAGTVVLGAISTYTGGTKVQSGGTLDLNAGTAAGSGAITFGAGFGELQIQSAAMSGNSFNSNTIGGIVAGDVIDLPGLAFHAGATASLSGAALNVTSGSTTQTLGAVSGSPSGFSVVQDAGSGSAVIINTFTVASLADLTTDLAAINIGGVDAFAGVNYSFDFTNTFALGSTQTIDLATGSSLGFAGVGHTTGGGYDVVAGTLAAGAAGAIGTGAVTLAAGSSLNLGTFNQTIGDLSGAGAISISSATLTAGTGNSTGFSGVISGAGELVKQGSGTLTLAASSSYGGGTLLNGGEIVLGATGAAGSGKITFGTGTILAFGSAAAPSNIIAGLVQNTDTIDLTGVTVTSANLVNTNTLAMTLSAGAPVDVTLDPGQSYAGLFPHSTTSGSDNFIILNTTPCFLCDTHILTEHGEVKVQDLAIGDRVVTLSGALRPITWIGTGHVLATPGRRDAATPVIVRKGALADNVPTRDLRVTKGHSLLIDDVLIPVEELVNHRSILWDDRAQAVTIYHIELATHDVLLADGAPAESYRDDGNRRLFGNANSGWDQPANPPCAPVRTSGSVVDAAWRWLLDRAGPRPGLPLTDEADLHLLVDGQRLNPSARHGAAYAFDLPTRPHCVRIVSRAGVPQELGLARDRRALGVALRRIVLKRGATLRTLHADDAVLTDGFHAFEPDNRFRWTDGDAVIPDGVIRSALLAEPADRLAIELHVAATMRYAADGTAQAAA